MSEDKRLNEVIRVHKRPNHYTMLDTGFLNNPELSWKAKGILAYLLSKSDSWKVIVGNLVNNATDGKAAVYNGLKELGEQGYYVKRPIRNEQGTRIVRWESIVMESPNAGSVENTGFSLLTNFQEIENQEIGNQDIENRERNNIYLSNIDSSNIDVSESTPAPTKNVYGELKNVLLTGGEYTCLIVNYGEAKTADYINRLDCHIASTGKRYKGHYATIKKWIADDDREADSSGKPKPTPTRPNRFANCEQRETNADQLKQLERLHLQGV